MKTMKIMSIQNLHLSLQLYCLDNVIKEQEQTLKNWYLFHVTW